jgi:hypothetical protein
MLRTKVMVVDLDSFLSCIDLTPENMHFLS